MTTLYHIEYEDFYVEGEYIAMNAWEMEEEDYIQYKQNGGEWDYAPFLL